MNGSPTVEHIKRAISEAGYLFEQQIAYELKKHNYLVTPNYNFEDVDSGESREIDLYAITGTIEGDYDVIVEQLLLIECKKTTNPMVFFSKPSYEGLKDYDKSFEIVGTGEDVDAGEEGILSLERFLKLSELSHRYAVSATSSQFCMIVRKGKGWEAKHEHVYNGMIVPLVKCLFHAEEYFRATLPRTGIQLRVIYPIVIIDSELYLMNSDTGELADRDWIPFSRQYESRNVRVSAMIDFVRYRYLEKYLESLRASFDLLTERIISHKQELLRKKLKRGGKQ